MAHHIGRAGNKKNTRGILHVLLSVSQSCVYAAGLIEALQKGLTQIKMAPYSFAVPTRPCYDCLCAPVWQSSMDVNQCRCFVQGSEHVCFGSTVPTKPVSSYLFHLRSSC